MEFGELGIRLRRIRKDKSMTLQDVAEAAALSKSFLSQLESGQTAPSIGSLKRIATALEVSLWELLREDEQLASKAVRSEGREPPVRTQVVRRSERKQLVIPGVEAEIYLLTPDLQRKLGASLSIVQPGSGYGDESYTHPGEEFGIVLEGTYEVTVGDEVHVLEAGDTIYLASEVAHRTRVLGAQPVVTLWVNTPPTF